METWTFAALSTRRLAVSMRKTHFIAFHCIASRLVHTSRPSLASILRHIGCLPYASRLSAMWQSDHRKRKGGTKKPPAAGQASDLPPFASAAADAATNVRRVSEYPAEVESRCASPDKKKKRNQQDTSDRQCPDTSQDLKPRPKSPADGPVLPSPPRPLGQDASLSVAEDLGPAELYSPPRTRSSGAHPDDSFVFGSSESNNAPLDDDDDDSDYNDSDYNDSERPRGGD